MMAYFCGLYISSEVLTPNSMHYDLFGTKKTLPFKIQLHSRAHLSTYSITRRPKVQLSWRWDTGAPVVLCRDITKEHGKGNICSPDPPPLTRTT